MPSRPPAIIARGIRKTYAASGNQPPKQALKGIDLEIPQGTIFGLLGPNGAGKSTFINILAGLVIKSGGSASIWGFDIDENPRQARAAIGVVPQELNIDPFLTPAESIDTQAGLYGVPKSERRTDEILARLHLSEQARSYSRTLSGGMRRRLLVAKAMIHAPPILVLDEPTAGVDIDLRKQLWDYVLELNAAGVTIVLTTHYLEEAQTLCEQIAIIDHGALVACEETAQLLQRIDNKTLLITPQKPLKKAPRVQGVTTRLDSDGRVEARYNPREMAAGAVLAAVTAAGVEIADIDSEGSSLENVFLQLTSHAAG